MKPFLALHSGVKVLAITSILMAHLVKNFAAMEKSTALSSSSKQQHGPYLSERVGRFHDWAKSSILTLLQTVSQIPKNNQTSRGITVYSKDTKAPSKKGHLILLCKRNSREIQLLSTEKLLSSTTMTCESKTTYFVKDQDIGDLMRNTRVILNFIY